MKIIEEKSNLILKDSNIPLVILRPYDLFQFSMLIEGNSADSLKKIGSMIGKCLNTNNDFKFQNKKIKKKFFFYSELLNQLGFGKISIKENKKKKEIVIIVISTLFHKDFFQEYSPRAILNFYKGLFLSIFKGDIIEGNENSKFIEETRESIFIFYLKED